MSRKIKLIWDFRGEGAEQTATHHETHLKQFTEVEKMDLQITGFEKLTAMHAIAFIVVNEIDMIKFRDILKPHRGEVYDVKN